MNGNWLTPEQTAELLQIPLDMVQRWMEQKRIPYFSFYDKTQPLIPLSGLQIALRGNEEINAEIEALGEEE